VSSSSTRRMSCRRPATLLVALAGLAVAPDAGAGQTIQGHVVDAGDGRGVATAIVRLVDESGEQRAVSAADSSGAYRIMAPGPGVFRLRAERIGYVSMETPLLEAESEEKVYPLDLVMEASPVPIPGLEVTTEQIDRQLRLLTGIDPSLMRWQPLRQEALRSHVERAHDLTDLMRWGNFVSIEVRESFDGPCYLARRYGCLPVYLDGFSLTPETFDLVPLDMLNTVVVLAPNESIAYPRGAVLMYSAGWIR
jgi:hypothetical protein